MPRKAWNVSSFDDGSFAWNDQSTLKQHERASSEQMSFMMLKHEHKFIQAWNCWPRLLTPAAFAPKDEKETDRSKFIYNQMNVAKNCAGFGIKILFAPGTFFTLSTTLERVKRIKQNAFLWYLRCTLALNGGKVLVENFSYFIPCFVTRTV